jgi:hypothetical protein
MRRSSKPRKLAPSLPSILRNTCFLIAALFTVFWLATFISSHESSANKKLSSISKRLGGRKHRIAMIIPFIGEGPEAIPPYLEMFCTAAAGSSSLVDFLLIHNGVLDAYHGDICPNNVIFISLSTMDDFSRALVKVVDEVEEGTIVLGSKDKLARVLSKLIRQYPYLLVEFKPALGHIFSEYIKGYSHWGYSDLDILFGDLQRFVTPDELNDYVSKQDSRSPPACFSGSASFYFFPRISSPTRLGIKIGCISEDNSHFIETRTK